MNAGAAPVDYLPPADEHNPYAAPESSLKSDRLPSGQYGEAPITEPNPNARVRMDAIGEAWGLFKEKMGTWVLIVFIYFACVLGIGMVAGLVGGATQSAIGVSNPPQAGDMAGFILVTILQQVFTQVLTALFVVGLFRVAIRQVRGLPIQVGDMFSAADVWLTAVVATFLVALATIGGFILLIIPGLYISARLMFTLPLVADGRLKATEAMGLSWRALNGQVFMAWWFMVVVTILSGIGFLACGIGILFTMPLYSLSIAVLYRDFFLAPTQLPDSPWIDAKPDIAPEF